MTAKSVFISYSSHDKQAAERICTALERRGFACWIAGRDVGPGQNFQESIVEAIIAAKAMILVFSDNANNSNEIKKELAIASHHRLVVMPVRIEDVAPTGAFAYELATRQWIDLFGEWGQAIERLAAYLRDVIPAEAVDRVEVSPAVVPPSPRASLLWPKEPRARALRVVAGLLVLSVIAGSILWLRERATSFRDCATCPEMVVVPTGTFTMGSPASEADRDPDESPQHFVRIAKPLAVSKFAITVGEYAAFVEDTGYDPSGGCSFWLEGKWMPSPERSWRNPGFSQSPSHPVVCLNWRDAKAYAAWLANRTGKPYRLLTEAEWEYAARAGTTTRYYFGDRDSDFCRYGNGADQTAKRFEPDWSVLPCNDLHLTTAPVGSFLPNGFGLYDMSGNAWQWVEDCYLKGYRDAPVDGSARAAADCPGHSLRGGAWNDDQRSLRSASRNGVATDERNNTDGLRVARGLD